MTLVYGLIGTYINENRIDLAYHAQTAIIVIPICTMGYFFRINSQKIEKIKKLKISIPILIISTILMLYMIMKKNIAIELAIEKIGGSGYMFYIASFIGICFCISASRVIEKIPLLNKIIALLGKHSFSIMALHFACIKGVDAIYSRIIGETDPEVISKWVVTYPKELWIIYIIIGCGLPVIFSIVLDKIKKEREKI